MKKLLSTLLALAMLVTMTACGGNDSKPDPKPDPKPDSSAASSAPVKSETEGGETTDGQTFKVGIVNYVDDASLNQIVNNLEAQLDAKGTELGVTFNYADYYDNAQADPAVLTQIGANMKSNQVDIIVAVATPTAITMLSATEDTDIPVIFAAVSYPEATGLVESNAAPGGRTTGTSDALDVPSVIDLITANNPDIQKVGLLYDTAQDGSLPAIAEAKELLTAKNIQFVEKSGSNTNDVLMATQQLIDEGVEAVFTPTDNTIMTAEQSVADLLNKAKIPHFCGADSFALWGSFVGYGVNYATLGTATADIVVDVLVNGKDVAAYPVVTFENAVSINVDTVELLGYDLDAVKSAFDGIGTGIVELHTAQEFE